MNRIILQTPRRRTNVMSRSLRILLLQLFILVCIKSFTIKANNNNQGNYYSQCWEGYTSPSSSADTNGDGILDPEEYTTFVQDDLSGCLEGYVLDAYFNFATTTTTGEVVGVDMTAISPNIFCTVLSTALDWACPPVSSSPAPTTRITSAPSDDGNSSPVPTTAPVVVPPPTLAPEEENLEETQQTLYLPLWVGIQYDTTTMTSIEEQREQQELFELVLPAFLVASLDQVVREEEDNIMAITEKDSSEGGGAAVSSESESSVVSWEIVNRLADDDLAVDEDSCQDPFSFCWYAIPSVILKVMAEEDNYNEFLYDSVNNNSNNNLIVDELQSLLVFSVRTDRLETILRNKLAFFFSWDDEDVTGGNDQISIDIQFLGTTNTDPTPSPTANTGADPSGAIDPSEPTNNNSNGEGKNNKSVNVGLGVALGIGFALIVAITVSILVVRQRRRRTSSDDNHTTISKQQQQDLDDDGEQTIQFHNHRRASAPVPGAFPSIHDGIASPSSLMLVTKDSHDDSEHGGFMVFEDPVDAIFEDPVDPEYYEDYTDGMDMRPLDMETPLDPAILEILSSPPGSSKKQRQTLSGTNNNAKEEDPLDVLTSLSFFSPGKTRDNRGGTTTTLSSPNSAKESSELCWISATTGDSLTVADMVMAERTKNRSGKAMPSPAKSYNSSEGTGDSDIWSSEDGDGPRSSLAVGVWEEFEQPDLATKVSSEDEEIWFIDDDEEGGNGGEDHDVSSSAAVQTRGVPQPQSINRGTSDKRLRSPPNNNAAPSINPRVNLVLKEKKIRDWENRHNVNIPPN